MKSIASLSVVLRICATASLLALLSCEQPPEPVTMRIGVLRTQSILPYYVMQEQGYDRKYGLRFVESTHRGGLAGLEAIAAGSIDMTPMANPVPLLTAAARGLIPGKVIPVAANNFADRAHPASGVVVAHHVRDWKGLEGKQIATNARTSITTAATTIRLKQEGVNSYSFVEMPFSNMGLAVASGNVAAATLNEPFLAQALARGDGKLLGWVVGGPPFERMQYSSIVFSADFHRRNPEAVKAYLRAHLAAVRWINKHPDEARQVLAKRMGLTHEAGKKISLLHWPLDARSDPVVLEQNQRMLLETGLLKRAVDVRALHDETLLAEVLKEKRWTLW